MPSLNELFLSIFLSKKARENLKAVRRAKATAKAARELGTKGVTQETVLGGDAAEQAPNPEREKAIRQIQKAQGNISRERAELLLGAMRVHRAKQKIFHDLNDEQRQKLVAMAMKTLLNENTSQK